MIRAFLLLVGLPLLVRADDTTWSKSLNGLQARLFISAPVVDEHGRDRRPHMQLFFQLQRRDDEGALMQVAYTPGTLDLHMKDDAGNELASAAVAGNQIEGPWQPLILPRDAFLSFPIGRSSWDRSGVWEGEYLDFHFWTQWKIAPSPKTYYLEGTFSIPGVPRDFSNPNYVWRGKIALPKIQIPRIP